MGNLQNAENALYEGNDPLKCVTIHFFIFTEYSTLILLPK